MVPQSGSQGFMVPKQRHILLLLQEVYNAITLGLHEVRDANIYAEFPTQPNSEMSMITPSGPLSLTSALLGPGAPRDDWRLPVSFRGVSRVAPACSILWAQSITLSTINPMW